MDALLGYIVALVLSMLSLAGFTTWAKVGVTNVQTAAVASQMLVFNKAAQQYVQDNAATLVAQAGARGDFVPDTWQLGDATMTPNNAYGAFGGWRVSLTGYTNPGSGHLA